MNKNKRLLIVVGIVSLVLIVALLSIKSLHRSSSTGDDKQPETGGGPPSVALENTYKLNALLPPPLFFAVKDDVSKYVQQEAGIQAQPSIVQDTQLNPDGSISLTVKIAGGKTFSANVRQDGDRLSFQVPSSNYQVIQSVSAINDQYGGN